MAQSVYQKSTRRFHGGVTDISVLQSTLCKHGEQDRSLHTKKSRADNAVGSKLWTLELSPAMSVVGWEEPENIDKLQ
jgi:hypothetical protein